MKLRFGGLLVAISFGLAACQTGSGTTPASSQPKRYSLASTERAVSTRVPVEALILHNPCNGEVITVTGGTYHFLIRFDLDNEHFMQEINTSGFTGVGQTTGARYVFIEQSSSHINNAGADPDRAMTFTGVSHHQVIGQGQVPDFYSTFLGHFTVNANGEVTAEKIEPKVECR